MKSVADELRAEQDRRHVALTPAQRVALAFELGRRDVERFRLAHDLPLSRREARRLLERERQVGRTAPRCMSEIIG